MINRLRTDFRLIIGEQSRNDCGAIRVLKLRPRDGCVLVSRKVASPPARRTPLIELGESFSIAEITVFILIRRCSRQRMTDGY